MKRFYRVLMVVVFLLFSASALAAGFDGVYKFSWRSKGDVRDLDGWWGMMVVNNNVMTRIFHSPNGKETKYYVGTLTKSGDNYKQKFFYAYKPEYVGNEHDNKITLAGKKLTMESPDGGKTFKELWEKQ